MNSAANREKWERCWASAPSGVPGYFAPGELQQLALLRGELFDKYLRDVKEVSEFGCGIGHNLIPLIGQGKRLRAFDWSANAVKFCRTLGLEAQEFDMLNPDMSVDLQGAVLTVHAMEQLGANWEAFLTYLLSKNFEIAIHIEPIEELYDDSARDQVRLAYHHYRGYLSKFLTWLRKMETDGEVEILEVRKSPFGGKDHDAYSVIVWRPL